MELVVAIKMDGGSWLCYDERFIDLNESEYYGFGDSPEEALATFLATCESGGHLSAIRGARSSSL